MVEVEKVVSVSVMVNLRIEVHKNINITMLIEPWSKYGTKGIQLSNLVFSTQSKELMNVVVYEMHITKLIDYKSNVFNLNLVGFGIEKSQFSDERGFLLIGCQACWL